MRIENPRLKARFAKWGVEHRPDEFMAHWTSLAVGGATDVLVVRQPHCLPELIETLNAEGIPRRLLGGGTNLLVRDGELPWIGLHLAGDVPPQFEGHRVRVSAAADLGRTVMECARRDLGAMEGLIGVPGSVGGALRMNAGAYGTEIGQVVRTITVLREATNQIETLPARQAGFSYRHSAWASGDILLEAELELPSRSFEDIRAAIRLNNQKRRASQPLNERSAGCIFKNPPGVSVGKMADELGLKGHRMGGAVISERHANFFINRFRATADDLLRLMDFVRNRIREAFGYELENEVILWTD